jgi:hypothetical protein
MERDASDETFGDATPATLRGALNLNSFLQEDDSLLGYSAV